ncbi:unnamed protein product, partial [Iphiclides podalirius]
MRYNGPRISDIAGIVSTTSLIRPLGASARLASEGTGDHLGQPITAGLGRWAFSLRVTSGAFGRPRPAYLCARISPSPSLLGVTHQSVPVRPRERTPLPWVVFGYFPITTSELFARRPDARDKLSILIRNV